MRSRVLLAAAFVVLTYGCATTTPQVPQPAEVLHGIASWYGEEFAGRTTANGEIFDPTLLTAAHRTFPFGTVLDITNPKTTQTVRVRVNDRGPYIGNRVIDLSYAAAQQIGLIEPGVGDVDIKVVRVGSGEREAPAPFDVTIAEAPKTAPLPTAAPAADVPPVEFPLPATPEPEPAAPSVEAIPEVAVVDRITVETQHGDVITRKQVGADGRTLEEVPVGRGEATTASSLDEQRKTTAVRRAAVPKRFIVQVGAFAVEANAKSLQERLSALGQRAFIERDALYRVRIGPFATRDKAAETRATLEASGISAMIVSE
jgi:rare lipoprotein A